MKVVTTPSEIIYYVLLGILLLVYGFIWAWYGIETLIKKMKNRKK